MNQSKDRFEKVEIRAAAEFWAWLSEHHAQTDSVWLVTWKAAQRDRYVSREEVLDALIAYGWIDGRRMKLDVERTMQLISPRKEQTWAETYKRRAGRLEAEGRMTEAGRAAILLSKQSGNWDGMSQVDRLDDPADLVAALCAADAYVWWQGSAPSYRCNILRWVGKAKRPATRSKRIDIVAQAAAKDKKVPNY